MWQILLVIFLGLLTWLYVRIQKKFNYFASKGVAQDPGYFPLGSNSSWKLTTGKLAFTKLTDETYQKFPEEKIVGWYGPFGEPTLIIRDLEIAKAVLIKDFAHFVDRRKMELSKKTNKYFLEMLFSMTGDKWKRMRAILSPVFTSGKLKAMIPMMNQVGDELVKHLETFSKEGKMFEAKQVMVSYTLDVIAMAGIGIQSNSYLDPDSQLRKNINRITNPPGILSTIKMVVLLLFPKFGKLLDLSFFDQTAMDFIANLVRHSLESRKQDPSLKRNDLIDVLIEAMKDYEKGSLVVDDEGDQFYKDAKIGNHKVSNTVFTEEEIESALIANATLFFFAGFDNSAMGMAITMYFLAKNPDVQERLYDEICDAVEKTGNEQFDYDTIQEMPYLEQVVQESLRMYFVNVIERLCVEDYKIPGTNFVVPAGMLVQIASPMIMKDQTFFASPYTFDPDHFSGESKQERGPYPYMVFGHGPRNCIGMRFALLVMKSALARLVKNYKLVTCSKTVEVLEPEPTSPQLTPKGGVWLKVEKREK